MWEPKSAVLEVMDVEKLLLKPGQSVLIPLSVSFPSMVTAQVGRSLGIVSIIDSEGVTKEAECQLLGPKP